VICSTFTANVLSPGAVDGIWHVDHPYWTLTQPYPDLPLAGQCIWPLDDFTVESGATVGIPGSHRRDHPPPNPEGDWSDHAEVMTAPRGSVIFAHGAWWHASRRNQTDRLRSALLVTYTHTFCVPQDELRGQLAYIDAPNDLVVQLLGGNQYQPGTVWPHSGARP
jgi:ectoine hydroxylase-related dioxygenase (phytanoyl-CoA dioxygenase family)